ncbi:hypothetical protein QTP88_016660 [Uroleucon formosanum]
MTPTHCILVTLSLCAVASSVAGCKYTVESYTTTDAMIVNEAAFIAQVSAECEDSPSNLYAEVEGRLLVAANAGPNKYQVSWLDDFKKARRGDYYVKFYDEAGYGQLRKLLRDGESTSSVTPVHSVYVRYPGAYKGVWVNSEFLAAIVCMIPPTVFPNAQAKPKARSYAEAAANNNSTADIITTVLSQFITNLNSVIGPLISLLTEALQKRYIQPICLPILSHHRTNAFVESDLFVTGWGSAMFDCGKAYVESKPMMNNAIEAPIGTECAAPWNVAVDMSHISEGYFGFSGSHFGYIAVIVFQNKCFLVMVFYLSVSIGLVTTM